MISHPHSKWQSSWYQATAWKPLARLCLEVTWTRHGCSACIRERKVRNTREWSSWTNSCRLLMEMVQGKKHSLGISPHYFTQANQCKGSAETWHLKAAAFNRNKMSLHPSCHRKQWKKIRSSVSFPLCPRRYARLAVQIEAVSAPRSKDLTSSLVKTVSYDQINSISNTRKHHWAPVLDDLGRNCVRHTVF